MLPLTLAERWGVRGDDISKPRTSQLNLHSTTLYGTCTLVAVYTGPVAQASRVVCTCHTTSGISHWHCLPCGRQANELKDGT